MINIKTRDEIEKIKICGAISSAFFKYIEQFVKPGMTTKELDTLAETFLYDHGARPSFKGYSGYPSSICASVNEEVIHGIPCRRVLKNGDIIGIDIGVQKNGLISDSAKTFKVGEVSKEVEQLMKRTEISLYKGIAQVASGRFVNDIGTAIENYIKQFNYGIVRDYCGHGVGYSNHEEPEVLNYKSKNSKKILKTGMVIAIEPMINLGKREVSVCDDGWTVITTDSKYSAHYEHTVAVTDNGYEILTISPEEHLEVKKHLIS